MKEVIDSEDMLHFKLITKSDGYTGLSPIEQCKNAISWGLDLEKYGKSFFENGAKLSGVLESDRTLSTEATLPFDNKSCALFINIYLSNLQH